MLTKNTKKHKYRRIANYAKNGKQLEVFKSSFSEDNLGGTLAGTASAVLGGVTAGLSAAETDTSQADNAIQSINSYNPDESSLDALADSYNNIEFAKTDWTGSDFTKSTGDQLMGMASAAIGGASSMANSGGIGAAIGAGLGALGSGIGWLVGNAKAKKQAALANAQAELGNMSAQARAESARDAIMNEQANTALRNIAAKGGRIMINNNRNLFSSGGLTHQHGGIFSNGVTIIDNGGTHEENPFEGVQIGVDYKGIPNLVEEGEVIWNDYVFSNRLKVPGKKHTFAVEAEKLQEESEERPNDPISKNGLEDSMTKLMQVQEMVRQQDKGKHSSKFSKGGIKSRINKFDSGSWLRYMPAVGSGLAVLSDAFGLTNKPNYSNIEGIKEATDSIKPVGYTPISTKMTYKPFATDYYANKLLSQSAATKQAIQNQAINSQQAMANLMLTDYNSQSKLGDLYRQAEEYNQAQRERVLGFNRQTEGMNSELAMKAAIANQANNKLKLSSATTQAQMKDQIDAQASAARSANLSNLFTNLGNIGTDIFNRQQSDMLLSSGVYGTLSTKPAWWSDKQWADYQEGIATQRETPATPTTPAIPTTPLPSPQASSYVKGTDPLLYESTEEDPYWYTRAKGGKIKRRRKIKKGLTY